jgi:hypothetical protein
MGEEKRRDNIVTGGSPSLFETTRQLEGVIYKVHEEKLLIKVYDSRDGSTVAEDKWIPLAHSPQEITERFGTIRQGMVVLVGYSGPNGSNAVAQVMFNEEESTGTEAFADNSLETGLFEIFKPGA